MILPAEAQPLLEALSPVFTAPARFMGIAANIDDGATAQRLLAGLPAVRLPRLAVLRVDNEYRDRGLDLMPIR